MSGQDHAAAVEETLEPAAEGVVVRVRATPGGRKNAVTGVREGELCVVVTAPADRGRANVAIAKLLAKSLGVAGGRVGLVTGLTNRHKRFVVEGVTAQEAAAALRDTVAGSL